MILKEALLNSEIIRIKQFLKENGLDYENNITKSFYIEENDIVVASVSIFNNVIKCFAVSKEYRSENYGGILISHIINYFYENKIYHYMVYTKKEYLNTFKNLGFNEIVSTDTVVILEAGTPNIQEYLNDLKKKIEYKFENKLDVCDVASLVMNCNPITEGHLGLIELASKNHQYLIVFLLEEDLSYFTYKERMTLVYLATLHLPNVIVVPSSSYIVSSLTFPNYFLKDETLKNKEWASTDALIFKNYFMKYLNIKYRYVGTESSKIMIDYNNVLKEILGSMLIEINRFESNGKIISASLVRKCIEDGKIDEALEYIPRSCRMLFYSMAKEKYLSNDKSRR